MFIHSYVQVDRAGVDQVAITIKWSRTSPSPDKSYDEKLVPRTLVPLRSQVTARATAAAVEVLLLPQVPRHGFRQPSTATLVWDSFGDNTFQDVSHPAVRRGGPGQKRKDVTEILQLVCKLSNVVVIVEL